MTAVTKIAGNVLIAVAGAAAAALFTPTAAVAAPVTGAAAAVPELPQVVAYIRGGDVYTSKGPAETRLTTGGGYSRPRFSPDGKQLAVLKNGQLWTMTANGSGQRRLTTRPAAGASWAPDGKSIAFASLSCTGGAGVYRISTTTVTATPQVMFPSECRGEALPAEPAVSAPTGDLTARLRTDDAVAWSPDGAKVAFRGGNCESIYDSCLSVGTVATGGEKTVAAFGGGSLETSGFAVVPSWRSDGAKLSWTTEQQGETTADDQPVHIVEHDYLSASALAFADRNRYLGDDTPRSILGTLLSPAFAAARACLIPESAALPEPVGPGELSATGCSASAAGAPTENGQSTTNMTIADRWGNVVEYTLTIEQTGGNGMVVPGRGFLLNNEMTDFNFTPTQGTAPDPNLPGPDKRPRSSIAPTIVLKDGRPFLAVGSPGGATIITTVLQILVDRLDLGMTLPQAMAAPRASDRNLATGIQAEPAYTARFGPALTALGHVFQSPDTAEIGAATAIEFTAHDGLIATAEPTRRGGGAAAVVHPTE